MAFRYRGRFAIAMIEMPNGNPGPATTYRSRPNKLESNEFKAPLPFVRVKSDLRSAAEVRPVFKTRRRSRTAAIPGNNKELKYEILSIDKQLFFSLARSCEATYRRLC